MSAFLYGERGRSTRQLSRFLLTRGIWLVLIELTLVRLAWTFSFDLGYFFSQVIFAIGASMIALSLLVFLPRSAVAAIALVLIAWHNLLDPIKAEAFGPAAPIWNFLHEPALLQFGATVKWFAVYPLIPWIGVMAAGYAPRSGLHARSCEADALARWMGHRRGGRFRPAAGEQRLRRPAPWSVQAGAIATLLSFINCEKYPPSLLYLSMTIGPTLLLLAGWRTRAAGSRRGSPPSAAFHSSIMWFMFLSSTRSR